MSITLYHCPGSTPCHAVRTLANMLGVSLTLKRIRVTKGEQMTQEYLKINPMHTIPTIVDHSDGEYTLWESRAIMTYLCDQYSEGGTALYPRNPRERAQVIRWLVYDAEKTYLKVLNYVMPYWFLKQPVAEARKEMEENFDELDNVLSKSEYLAGDTLTIADICLRSSIGQLDYTPYVIQGRSHLVGWMRRLDELPERLEIRKEYLEYIDNLRKIGEIL